MTDNIRKTCDEYQGEKTLIQIKTIFYTLEIRNKDGLLIKIFWMSVSCRCLMITQRAYPKNSSTMNNSPVIKYHP